METTPPSAHRALVRNKRDAPQGLGCRAAEGDGQLLEYSPAVLYQFQDRVTTGPAWGSDRTRQQWPLDNRDSFAGIGPLHMCRNR